MAYNAGIQFCVKEGIKVKKRLPKSVIAALGLLILSSLVFGVVLIFQGTVLEIAVAVVVFLSAVAVLIMSLIIGYDITKYVTEMDKDIVSISRETFYDFPEPIIIADEDEKIVWYNKSFEERLFGEDRAYALPLSDLVGNNTSKIFAQSGAIVKILDRYYRVSARQSE